ncbi:hypothetical protein H6F46_05405 [Limnothrix sp. FACHB-1083]|uniref:hypothetical protein n=1 Tax=unclassified Limnothrix TaxID=2632864 RepID=UPI00168165A3|nr:MULTISPECIES: hypothetical protein [unclassified Limnothrix]MBD2160127.1 hypothetical protein [Limnothrix sp. FACHB-1083]MBD2190829.1 hypothetical protein [Limnothrix sp. FACHB-1088]
MGIAGYDRAIIQLFTTSSKPAIQHAIAQAMGKVTMKRRGRRWPLQTWQRWLLTALAEILLGLLLFAIAPFFLNSHWPLLGFAIVLGVPIAWVGSLGYGLWRWLDARRARTLLAQYDPVYRRLRTVQLLAISSRSVEEAIETLQLLNQDEAYRVLNRSPLDLLQPFPDWETDHQRLISHVADQSQAVKPTHRSP